MYHEFNQKLELTDEKKFFLQEPELGNKPDKSRFSCSSCKKNNWSSIETFRVHKRHCKERENKITGKIAIHKCVDCNAEFADNKEYRHHIRLGDKQSGAKDFTGKNS